MREIKLPSGAILKLQPSPFAVAKGLYQAVLREVKMVRVSTKEEVTAMLKDAFCIAFSSPEIEMHLWQCFARCTYNSGAGDMKITEDTFEPVERRDDYMKVCMEVAKENLTPFLKSLFADFQSAITTIENIRA